MNRMTKAEKNTHTYDDDVAAFCIMMSVREDKYMLCAYHHKKMKSKREDKES